MAAKRFVGLPAWVVVLILTGGVVAGTAGCCTEALGDLDPEHLTWVTYRNPQLGYSLEYPSIFRLREHGGTAIFRYGWGVPVLVRFTDEADGRHRGLWFGQDPTGPIELSGRQGQRYAYEHWDGPFSSRTVSYVIPLQGRYLGFEFRTGGDLNPVQQRMLDSFKLSPETPTD